MFIIPYHLVKGQTEQGMLMVMAQHKRVLSTNSDPLEAILSGLLKLVIKIYQQNHHIVLGIDANEMYRKDGPTQDNGISKFCSASGLVDAIYKKHDQCHILSCDWSSGTPIDFILCFPALLPFIRVGMISVNEGGSLDHR